MKRRNIFLLFFLLGLVSISALLYAQTNGAKATGKDRQSGPSRVDLQTQTWVGKRLEGIDEPAEPGGPRTFRYVYRVEARPGLKDPPRFSSDPQFNISYNVTGFKERDSIKLRSTNPESATDSNLWVYDVSYSGKGERAIEFSTSGSLMSLTFNAADSETEEPLHCGLCRHLSIDDCLTNNCKCRCCFDDRTNCDCIGCQYQNPRCFSCPVDCASDHCICSCGGCLVDQQPPCFECPVGCDCDHCRCKCEEDIGHPGRCGCVDCKKRPLTCDCECHKSCP